MGRIIIIVILVVLAGLAGMIAEGLAVDRVRYGVAARLAHYVTPLMAAEEQGFWKQNGLEVQWFSLPGAVALQKAIVGGSIDMGSTSLPDVIQASSRGVPMVSVANLNKLDYIVWVRTESPIRSPEGLEGAKIGIIALGGMSHAYGRFLARKLGLEGKIRFVGMGGIGPDMAALMAGATDARIAPISGTLPLVLEGRVRSLVSISQYFPNEWADNGISAPKWLIDKKPDVVRRTVKAQLQGVDFMLKDRPWTLESMKKEFRFTPEVASAMFDFLVESFRPGPRITRKAVENVRDFLIEYEIISKETTPPVDELFTSRFLE